MSNSLTFDPFAESSAGQEAGFTSSHRLERRTPYIPDEALRPLINAALELVDLYAPIILRANAFVESFRRKSQGRRREEMFRYHTNKKLRVLNRQLKKVSGSLNIDIDISNLCEFHKMKMSLRTACGILIAFVTGIRISELLSIEVGAVEIEQSHDGEFIWLHSKLYKTQQSGGGAPSKWLGGPIALKAVSILEKLTEPTRKLHSCRYLFIPITKNGAGHWNGKLPSVQAMDTRELRKFADFIGLRDENGRTYHLHAHMFRRTFARQVVRCDTTNLLALKDHFKHWSLAMTDGYVGIDEELQNFLDDENNLLRLDSFDKTLRSRQLAGRRGKEIVEMVDKAMADGRLPQEFRGEAGGHFRKKMIREFIDAGQEIYVCGASNYCWFRPDSADCTKTHKPIIEFCNPVGCANSVIEREEHQSYWHNIATETENLLAIQPKGEPYKARLASIAKIAKKIISDLE
jgi:integrase